MADETPPPPGAPGQPERRRPAPTIDLEATEIPSEPVAVAAGPTPTPPPEPPDEETAAEIPPKSAVHQSLFGLAAAVSWPLVAASAAGAVLTLGIVWVVLTLSAGQGGESATDARIAQLERQVADLAGQAPADTANAASVTDLASRLQKLEAQAASKPPPAPDPALPNRIAALESQLKSLSDALTSLGQRSESTAAANTAALGELSQKIARADKSEARSSEASDAAANANAAAIAALANRVDALEGGAKALEKTVATAEQARRSAEKSDDRAVRAAIIAAALAAAVERGDPFEPELKAAQAQGLDTSALAPLADFAAVGVPSESALARELVGLEPELLRAAGGVPSESGFLQKLQANAERLVRIRPVEEVAGDDPAAIIARAEIKAGRGDVAGALMELGALPATVRAPAQAWIEKAQARAAALAASRAFAADALAALATPSR
jgi:hypothetical protein